MILLVEFISLTIFFLNNFVTLNNELIYREIWYQPWLLFVSFTFFVLLVLLQTEFKLFGKLFSKSNSPHKSIINNYALIFINFLACFGLVLMYCSTVDLHQNSVAAILGLMLLSTIVLNATQILPYLTLRTFNQKLAKNFLLKQQHLSIAMGYTCFLLGIFFYFSSANFDMFPLYLVGFVIVCSTLCNLVLSAFFFFELLNKNFLHLFFYLCTLEILPWALFSHWINDNVLQFL